MKRWAARFLHLAISLALVLVASEYALRAFAPQPLNVLRVQPDGVFSHVRNLDIVLTGADYRTHVRTNSAGLRDIERPVRKPGGVTRLLVLGDSMVEGLQVELEETMPKRIEALLADALPDRTFDVINAGVSGAFAGMALRYLEKDGLAYDPDLVIVTITARNDVQEAADMREFPLPPGYDLRVYVRSRFHLYGLVEKVINARPGLRNALAVTGIVSRARPQPAAGGISNEVYLYDGKVEPLEALGYEKLFEAYGAMAALCRKRNIPLLFVILPSYFQATGYTAALGDPGRVGSLVRNDRATQDRLLAFFRERTLPAVDLLPGARLRGEAYYLPQDRHFNVAGHAFAAGETVRAILEMDLLPRRPERPSRGQAQAAKGRERDG